jgi:hypothetical protein
MIVHPKPDRNDLPVNKPETVELDPDEEATITYTAEESTEAVRLPVIAISKQPNTVYEIRTGGETVYGPSAIPPTDIDDLQPTFAPSLALHAGDSLKVTVSNLSTATRVFHIQPVGWEVIT